MTYSHTPAGAEATLHLHREQGTTHHSRSRLHSVLYSDASSADACSGTLSTTISARQHSPRAVQWASHTEDQQAPTQSLLWCPPALPPIAARVDGSGSLPTLDSKATDATATKRSRSVDPTMRKNWLQGGSRGGRGGRLASHQLRCAPLCSGRPLDHHSRTDGPLDLHSLTSIHPPSNSPPQTSSACCPCRPSSPGTCTPNR